MAGFKKDLGADLNFVINEGEENEMMFSNQSYIIYLRINTDRRVDIRFKSTPATRAMFTELNYITRGWEGRDINTNIATANYEYFNANTIRQNTGTEMVFSPFMNRNFIERHEFTNEWQERRIDFFIGGEYWGIRTMLK